MNQQTNAASSHQSRSAPRVAADDHHLDHVKEKAIELDQQNQRGVKSPLRSAPRVAACNDPSQKKEHHLVVKQKQAKTGLQKFLESPVPVRQETRGQKEAPGKTGSVPFL